MSERRSLVVGLAVLAAVAIGAALVPGGAVAGPIDANGTVTGCGEIDEPGVYELAGNVTNSSGVECVRITSSDVVFDGNGYTLNGYPSVLFGISIQYPSVSNVSVRNLTIEQYERGISIHDADGVTVSDVTVRDSWKHGVYARNVSGRLVVEDSTIVSNGDGDGSGLTVELGDADLTAENTTITRTDGVGLEVDNVSDASVRNSTVSGSTDHGIAIYDVPGTTIRNNTVHNNSGPGLILDDGANGSIARGNTFTSNQRGIRVGHSPTSDVTVSNNTITGSGEEGIYSFDAAGITISGNNISNNGQSQQVAWGVHVMSSPDSRILANEMERNQRGGLLVSDSTNVTVVDNVANDTAVGFLVSGTAIVLVENNTATHNEFSGIGVTDGSGAVLRNNTATDNGNGFVLVDATDVTAVGNDASGNTNGTVLVATTNVTMRDTLAANNSMWAATALNGSTIASATNYTLADGESVDFSAHDVSLRGNATQPSLPANTVQLGPVLNATNESGDAWLELGYDGSALLDGQNESTTALWHEDGGWTRIGGTLNGSVDTVNATIGVPGTYVLLAQDENGEDGGGGSFVPPPADPSPPTAEAGPDRTVPVGETVVLDGTASSDDAGIAVYQWDLDGDGVMDVTGTTRSATFDVPGTHTVELTVQDGDGNVDSDVVNVTVEAATSGGTPSFGIGAVDAPDTVGPGETIEIGVEVTNDGHSAGETTVELVRDGSAVDSGLAQLAPGESATVVLEATAPEEPGTYDWTVGTGGSGGPTSGVSVTVGEDGDGDGSPGFGPFVAALAVAVALAIASRRR